MWEFASLRLQTEAQVDLSETAKFHVFNSDKGSRQPNTLTVLSYSMLYFDFTRSVIIRSFFPPSVFGVTGKCLFWRDGQLLLWNLNSKKPQIKIIVETVWMYDFNILKMVSGNQLKLLKSTSLNTDNIPHQSSDLLNLLYIWNHLLWIQPVRPYKCTYPLYFSTNIKCLLKRCYILSITDVYAINFR